MFDRSPSNLLPYIHLECFSPLWCRWRKPGKGPWTAFRSRQKAALNIPLLALLSAGCCSCSGELQQLWIFMLSRGLYMGEQAGEANTTAAGGAAVELLEEECFQKTSPLPAFTQTRGKSRTAMQHHRLFSQAHLQGQAWQANWQIHLQKNHTLLQAVVFFMQYTVPALHKLESHHQGV